MRINARSGLGICLILLFLSFWTLFFRLGALPLSGGDEPRYARIAQEMEEDGRWVTPTLERKPWLEKPPLYYWITIPIYSALGHSETTARLGTAAFGFLTAMSVLWLGRSLWSLRAGLLGAVILLTSLGFAGYARAASTDMPLTACLTITLSIFVLACTRLNFARRKLWVGYAFLGLACLAKGPVAVALVTGIAMLFWCFDERGGSLRALRPFSGLVVTAAVSLPWYWLVFRQNGFSFISVFFINHNLARYVSDIHHHAQPFYYYLPVLIAMLFPWSGWAPALAPDSWRAVLQKWKEWDPAILFLLCWILFPLLFFSFSVSKLAGYILPILPPLALLLGARFAEAWDDPDKPLRRGSEWMHLALTAALAIAAPVVFATVFDHQWKTGVGIACAVLVPGGVVFSLARRCKWRGVFLATCCQAVILLVTVAIAAYPVLGDHYSTRGIAQEALRVREPGEPIVTYRFFHHTLYYYTGYQVSEELLDAASLRRFLIAHQRVLVVTERDRIPELQAVNGISTTLLMSQSNFRLLRIALEETGAREQGAVVRARSDSSMGESTLVPDP